MFDLNVQILDKNSYILPEINRKVAISSGASFKIGVKNPYAVRLEVQLFLNSKVVGNPTKTWILNPNQSGVIETYNEKNLLMFENYEALNLKGIADVREDFGLISVRFRTEMPQDVPSYLGADGSPVMMEITRGFNSNSLSKSSGAITNGGTSYQKFSLTNGIMHYGGIDTIYSVRLVEKPIEVKVPDHLYA